MNEQALHTDPISIGLIEDNQLMRMCIEEFVSFHHDMTLLFSCSSMESWQDYYAVNQTCPSFLLLDLGLPGIAGFDAIFLLKEKYPLSQLLIISGESSGEKVWQAIAGGAIAYLPKPFSPKDLMQQFSLLKMGKTGLLPNANNKLDYGLKSIQSGSLETMRSLLTKKENEILEALLSGLDIAGMMKHFGITRQAATELTGKIYAKAAPDQKALLINRVLLSRKCNTV